MAQLRVPVTSTDHAEGHAKAALILVEYGDYQCPFCGEAYLVVKQLQYELGSNLLFVFRNFPLADIHPFALPAAAAAEAAGVQAYFWAMHDRLFENQQLLDPGSLLNHARALRLNVDRFVSDTQSPNVQRRIARDMEGGARSGVNGTPTFFANGFRVDGGYAHENLAAALTGLRV
jgi:protein-disulfide isomerase